MTKTINIVERGRARKQGVPWRHAEAIDLSGISHPVDQAIIGRLESLHVGSILEDALDQVVSATFGMELATGIRVDEVNFAKVYKDLVDISNVLHINVPYTVISSSMTGINAFATGTDKKPFVVLSNSAPALLAPQELRFILAHECGHIAMGHMAYHTAGQLAAQLGGYIPVIGDFVLALAVFPLSYWNRCSEITADRIGLIACGDLQVAQRALLRLVGGLTAVDQVSIDHYIAQSRKIQDEQLLGRVNEFFASHPLIHKRLEALEMFSRSEPYFAAVGRKAPAGMQLLTKADLDERVGASMRVL